MRYPVISHFWPKAIFVLTIVTAALSQALAIDIAKNDVLLHIVSQCVDPSKANYCTQCMLPRGDANCGVSECKKTNEVWALNTQYVAIRDIKMCGCPSDFVHGLAMPRDVITGIEDGRREEGIWQFAWDVGSERIEAQSLALAVNPRTKRTQNQLHIHLVRLNQNAREKFLQYSPSHVNTLKHIWTIAESDAKAKGLIDYGILVVQEAPNHYSIVITPNSPEAEFTQWSCS